MLAAHGSRPCASIAEAVEGGAIVILMLEAGPVVGNAIAAALPVMAPCSLWIDMSSTGNDEALASHH